MNWIRRIDIAEKEGGFSEEDLDAAESWFTCACGSLDKDIERGELGAPEDDELRERGVEFWERVDINDFSGARTTLDLIQRRAAVLIGKKP